MFSILQKVLLGSMLSLVAFAASAQVVIDTTDAEAALAAGETAALAIGGVILALAAVIAVYKWVTRAAR